MTWYLRIKELGRPADLNVQESDRVVWAFNIIANRKPTHDYEKELAKALEDASVGERNVDIFVGSRAVIPDGDGPYLVIIDTGGPAGEGTQNDSRNTTYEQATAQISVRARTTAAARAMTHAAFDALLQIRNTNLSS